MTSTEIIKKIYDSEIPCRIEWMYDAGFTWSIQNGMFPRLMKDDFMDGAEIVAVVEGFEKVIEHAVLEKDWNERGNHEDYDKAIIELAEAICKRYPDSDFFYWYKRQ